MAGATIDELPGLEFEVTEAREEGKETLGPLYRAFVFRVFRLCLSLGLSATDAEDASHEIILRADQALDRFRTGEPIWPWLARIAVNYCKDLRRREGKIFPIAQAADIPDGYGLEEEIHRRGCIRLASRALRRLSSSDARIIYLKDFENRPYSEIGVTLGLSLPAVKSKLLRARRDFFSEVEQLRRQDPTLPCLLIVASARLRLWLRRVRGSAQSAVCVQLLGVAIIAASVLPAGQENLYPSRIVSSRLAQPAVIARSRDLGAIAVTKPGQAAGLAKAAVEKESADEKKAGVSTPSVQVAPSITDPTDDSQLRIEIGSVNVSCPSLKKVSAYLSAECTALSNDP